jgi:hypothetical protein
VKFIAVGAGDNSGQSSAYAAQNRMIMPVFADNLGLMQTRYGFQISTKNIYQTRVIGADGAVHGQRMDEATIKQVIEQTKPEWKYKGKGYDAKLNPALDAFEWGNIAAGMKLLSAHRKSVNKALNESANKLYAAVKEEGGKWKEEADGLAESDPVKAYDLYQKIIASFPGDELAKTSSAAVAKLAKDKAVAAELAARKVYGPIEAGLARMAPPQKKQAAQSLEAVIKKFGSTPTGEKASALAKELSN